MNKHEASSRRPTLGLMKPGQSFKISADPDEVRFLRNDIARFRETMRFSLRKEGDSYRCTCIGDLLIGGKV
jgi:hypothetical protein